MNLRGFMVICSAILLMQLLADAPISANVKGSSNSPTKQIYAQKANAPIRAGDRLALKQEAPYFADPLSGKEPIDSFRVNYIGQPGESFSVQAVSGEMVSLQDSSRGKLWVPVWYTTEASSRIANTAPTYASLSAKAKLALTPGSSIQWSASALGDRGERPISVARWDDWYGIIASPAHWHEDSIMNRPILLWVHESQVVEQEEISTGLMEQSSAVPIAAVRDIADLLLHKGVSAEEVTRLLGQPAVREHSGNVGLEGRTFLLGDSWRFVRPEGHFIVYFSPAGTLETAEWIWPTGDEPRTWLYTGADYLFTHDFMTVPLPATLEVPSVWRNQGDLQFAYLTGASSDVLVVQGDDGRISGMHDDSNVYGVHRLTGEKLWQIDAGHGSLLTMIGNMDDSVTVYTSLSPEKKAYEDRVRHIRLADGKVLWEARPEGGEEGRVIEIGGAKDSVIIYDRPDRFWKIGHLAVLDRMTGKQKWEMAIEGDYRVLNTGVDDPYVLIQAGQLLQARDTDTGKIAWTLKADTVTGTDPHLHPYYAGGPRIDPFVPDNSLRRWILHGDQWLLVDLETGSEAARYPAKAGERFEVLNERYLLVQRELPAKSKSAESSPERYESVLYDVAAGKELWTLPGKASKGILEEEHMYLVLDGVPAKMELQTGRIVWKLPVTASQDLSFMAPGSYVLLDDYALIAYGHDLLALGKKDGHIAGRIQNIRMGYTELREQISRNGLLNMTGDEIYAGSDNGAFTRLSVKELEFILKSSKK
ncbi:PQQ-binding-like beta-propeller repeat protein [Paenibacillus fonticola]|uniref:outer membrane protein assembly factor BamB family protein n=1 Tax=Paenibacillus fonticola TaxID=379896 RepID=UPI000364BA62|nr:PQQ-binding-like beta-propeller repeat protein [Paenibacillus fonticola]